MTILTAPPVPSSTADERAALAGDDVAASPVEYALGALISCQVVVYRLSAQALGIIVDEIDVQAEGDLDASALFNPGAVRVTTGRPSRRPSVNALSARSLTA